MSEEMWSELEKIDILCDRLNLSYAEANRALKRANGDVIQALADCEREKALEEGTVSRMWNSAKRQFDRLWKMQINIKHDERAVLSVSAPIGVALGCFLWRRPALRMLTIAGAVAAIACDYEFELESPVELDEDFNYENSYENSYFSGNQEEPAT